MNTSKSNVAQTMALSKFEPLARVICLDDFDDGFCGWSRLLGNYHGDIGTMLPGYAQHTSPILSSLAHWDAGSHGAMDGNYALKIATRPKRGSQSVAIKRLTFRERGPIRLEAYLTFKPEATELRLSDVDVRSFGFLADLQVGDRTPTAAERVMPHVRYLNAQDGALVQTWQFKRQSTPFRQVGSDPGTLSHYHLAPQDWEDFNDGHQRLCYNEIATKVNWTYVRFDFDLASMKAISLRCNDREIDLGGFDSIRLPAQKNLWCMLNFCLFVESDADRRAFLYVDSLCISGDF